MRITKYLLPWFCLALLLLLVACGNNELDTSATGSLLSPAATNQPNIRPTETLRIMIPLYVDPINNRGDWVRVANASDRVAMNVIVNPSGGPAGCQTPQFQEALNLLTTRGITVLGYVATGFGNRDVSAIQADISSYQACSQFGGIFLDEVSRETNQIEAIRSMCSFVRGSPQFGRTVLNSGSQLDPRILEDVYCDTVVSFESNVNDWFFSYNPKSVTTATPDLFSGLVYGTSTDSLYQAVDLARQRGLGHVYLSADALPNPWSRVPAYWESMVEYIALGNSGTPVTPTPVTPVTPTPVTPVTPTPVTPTPVTPVMPTPVAPITPTPSPDTPPLLPNLPTAGNLLINPSFQNGLNGWQIDNCGSGSASISGNASDGNAAIALAGEAICIGQSVKVTASRSYTLSCDVKALDSGYGDVGLYGEDSELGVVEITGSSYTSISITGFSSSEYLYVSLYHEAGGTNYIDNCSLVQANTATTPHPPITGEPVTPTPIPPITGNNLLRNPSFESGLVAWELSDCGTGSIRSSDDASSGTSAMQLAGRTACVGQSIEDVSSGIYIVSCDVKSNSNGYVDMGLYADGVELNTTVIPFSSSYSRLSVKGYVSDKDNYLGFYIYKQGQGNIVIDNCVLIKE